MIRKKHTLEEKEKYDFGLIGIASPENDYRMIWILNRETGFSLARIADLEVYHPKLEGNQQFHQFEYFDDDSLLHYRMLGNKSESGYLLEEMSNVDFLLQIIGDFPADFVRKLVNKLNPLPEINLAFSLDPADLKSVKKLLL